MGKAISSSMHPGHLAFALSLQGVIVLTACRHPAVPEAAGGAPANRRPLPVLPAERSAAPACCRGPGAEAGPELGTGLASRDLHPTQQ
jgi:hypothetical protein